MTTPDRTIKVPSIEQIPPDASAEMRAVLESIIQSLDTREGRIAKNTNSRFVTIQDLVNAGVVADGVIK